MADPFGAGPDLASLIVEQIIGGQKVAPFSSLQDVLTSLVRQRFFPSPAPFQQNPAFGLVKPPEYKDPEMLSLPTGGVAYGFLDPNLGLRTTYNNIIRRAPAPPAPPPRMRFTPPPVVDAPLPAPVEPVEPWQRLPPYGRRKRDYLEDLQGFRQ